MWQSTKLWFRKHAGLLIVLAIVGGIGGYWYYSSSTSTSMPKVRVGSGSSGSLPKFEVALEKCVLSICAKLEAGGVCCPIDQSVDTCMRDLKAGTHYAK